MTMEEPRKYLDIHEEKRASDLERKMISDRLRRAHAQGRITAETMNRRLEHVAESVNQATLAWVVEDLPVSENGAWDRRFARAASYRKARAHRFHGGLISAILLVTAAGWASALATGDRSGVGGVVMIAWSILALVAVIILAISWADM